MRIIFKTILTLSIISLINVTSISAQESEVGIKGGLNFSNYYSNDVDDQNMRTSFQGGVFLKAALTDFFAIQPELLYTTKGSTVKYNYIIIGEGELTQKLTYIEMPVLGVINITKNFNVHAGPYVSYLMGAELENKSDNSRFNFVNDLDAEDFERIDYGLAAGVGFELESLRFGARYDYGMKNIGKSSNDENEPSVNNNSKNSSFSLYVGIAF